MGDACKLERRKNLGRSNRRRPRFKAPEVCVQGRSVVGLPVKRGEGGHVVGPSRVSRPE